MSARLAAVTLWGGAVRAAEHVHLSHVTSIWVEVPGDGQVALVPRWAELEDEQLLAAKRGRGRRRHLNAGEAVPVEDGLSGAVEEG